MAIIDEGHATLADDPRKFWEDTLKNTRILFFELDKAIFVLTHEERKSYSIDTGQTSMNVTRQDLPSLIDRREKLKKQIEELEDKLGLSEESQRPKIVQAVPGW